MRLLRFVLAMIAASATSAFAQPLTLPGAPCVRPPVQHCPDEACPAAVVTSGGAVVEVIDTKAGYVFDGTRQNPGSKAWGLRPRPGKADIFAFRNCKDGRIVADVVRLDKGHTEGLEPKVTEEIVKLMLSARGGKIQHGG